jgi:pilus assembly protein CpaC
MFRRLIPLLSSLALLLTPTFCIAQTAPPAEATQAENQPRENWIDVQAGQSLVWRAKAPIARLLLSDPSVAEVKLLEEEQFQVRGVTVGTTDLWVWYRDGSELPVEYQVSVHQDLSEMFRRIDAIVGDEQPPEVYPMKGRLVLDGTVADVETLERLAQIAAIYDPEFVNLMSVRGDHQVQLRVVFAEVSRTGLRELGFNWLFGTPDMTVAGYGPNYGDKWEFVAPDGNALDYFLPTTGAFQLMGLVGLDDLTIAGFLGALEEANLSKILAEPTLVALSGQEAEFLAGGEIPIPITTYDRVQVEFKEYGIKLSFVPTVLAGDVIDLRVYTEVSEIDNSVSITLGGVGIPGFITRKGSSHLRLQDGTTFAMAGLLSESIRYQRSELPLLGRIPIVGSLFRYTKHEPEQTEIMIFVTPELVRPMVPGEVPPLPTASEDNDPNDFELFLLGLDHKLGSRTMEETGPVGMER